LDNTRINLNHLFVQQRPGKLAVQARAGVQLEARSLGQSIGTVVKPAAQDFLRKQKLVIVSTINPNGQV